MKKTRTKKFLVVVISICLVILKEIAKIMIPNSRLFFFHIIDSFLMTINFGIIGGLLFECFKVSVYHFSGLFNFSFQTFIPSCVSILVIGICYMKDRQWFVNLILFTLMLSLVVSMVGIITNSLTYIDLNDPNAFQIIFKRYLEFLYQNSKNGIFLLKYLFSAISALSIIKLMNYIFPITCN